MTREAGRCIYVALAPLKRLSFFVHPQHIFLASGSWWVYWTLWLSLKMHWRHFVLLGGLGLLPSTLAVPNVRRQAPSGSHTSTGTTMSQTTSSETTSAGATSTEVPPAVSHSASLPHTPYSGTATTTGALTASSVGPGVPTLGVAPEATLYPSDGELHEPQPGPYIPAGGVGTNGSVPVYNVKSDFDFESLVSVILHLHRVVGKAC